MLQIKERDFDDSILEVDCGAWHIGIPKHLQGSSMNHRGYYSLSIRKNEQGHYEAYRRWVNQCPDEIAITGSLMEVVAWVNENYPQQSLEVVD
jgi:hypothetical protein